MAEQTPSNFDPFNAWRDWLSQFERQLNAFLNQQMSTDTYQRFAGGINRVVLDSQKAMGEMLARSTNWMNLPTRDELAALSERLAALEQRVKALEGTSATSNTTRSESSETPRPPRTRRPASGA